MTEYDNTNRGAIWKNDDRREGKNDPDFKGSVNADGIEYWVSAWKRKEGATAKSPALSFSLKPKEEQKPSISQRAMDKIYPPDRITTGLPQKRSIMPEDDEEIPF